MYRRTEAINTIAAYCQFKEGITYRLPQNKRVESHIAESGYVNNQKPESETTKQNLALKKRIQLFSSHRDISKHIKRKYLQNLSSSTVIAYNVCDKKFTDVMHFQRHANDSHSTVTGPLWRADSKQ
ncbi:hypothetical protein N7491_006578 [Penicillium cf. griseofulvum]|uniref:C2H2-type domain-containing protein n=1 Tax=Penicillium cf. griseofulvum TaxID=2972120 RepID=A0A9W9IWZ6_9EURO|nr:hypothetical protein N7472_010394 [Penicillium cf. griseofulvum]KAJ5429562.1 hypothetical protein N7491_006578 [Penicillium cf. griseofulvum]